jgi:hypothetical protein
MSVVNVQLKVAGRVGTFASQRKGSVFEMTNRRYRKIFLVLTNDPLDGPATIYGGPGIPVIGEAYAVGNDLDLLSTCVSVDCQPTEWPLVWTVTSEYDSDRIVDATLSNPLNLPAELTWSFAKYERVFVRDLLGTPCVNSSNQPFDPPPVVDDSRPVLTITRNEASFNSANAILYQDAVNTDNFGPAIPKQAKLTNIIGNKQQDIGVVYYKVTYEIEFRREGYDLFILDKGFRDISGNLYRDKRDFAPLANETLQNGRGQPLTTGTSTLSAAIAATDLILTVPAADALNFPPLGVLGFGGITPPDWYFEIKVDNEIMQVQNAAAAAGPTATWTIVRGFAGTTPAAHAAAATVTLQPYYRHWIPYKQLPFAPLALPTS